MSKSKRRQFVVLGREAAGGAEPLGRVRDVVGIFAAHNTSSDGSPSKSGTLRLYGPGMVVELPGSVDPVVQAMVSVNDEATAWPVIERVCKGAGWRLMDLESGRTMGW